MATVSVLNTSASISGKTLVLTSVDTTIFGLYTFDRDPSAPFAVSAASAVVTNLDADKLDGQEGAYYLSATNLATGNLAYARLPTGSGTWTIGSDLAIDVNSGSQRYFTVKNTGGGGNPICLLGTTVSTNAAAGSTVLPNVGKLRGVNAAGNDTHALIHLSATNYTVLSDGSRFTIGPYVAAASLPTAGANENGGFGVDSTNNRWYFYSATGTRYYITASGTF